MVSRGIMCFVVSSSNVYWKQEVRMIYLQISSELVWKYICVKCFCPRILGSLSSVFRQMGFQTMGTGTLECDTMQSSTQLIQMIPNPTMIAN